jgi:hypothetical protein
MESIISALEEERREAEKLIAKYGRELSKLPEGSFFVRRKGNGQYGYVTFSKAGKIGQRYLGSMSPEEIEEKRSKYDRAKKLKSLKKQAEQQRDFIEKALRHARAKSKRSA